MVDGTIAVAAPVVPGGKEIAVADPRDRRKRPVKGGHGRKRAAYLDWAQEDRDSEGIHLVLLELVTGQSVISAVSAPRQRVSLCVPIIAPYSPASSSISITRFPAFTRSAVSRRARSIAVSSYVARRQRITYKSQHGPIRRQPWDRDARRERRILSYVAKATRSRLTIDHLVWPSREKGRLASRRIPRICNLSRINTRFDPPSTAINYAAADIGDFRIYATLLLTSALCHRIRGIETTIGSADWPLDSTESIA